MNNRFISADYELYSINEGERELEEQTSPEHPFVFISGFGYAIDALENKLVYCSAGTNFDITLRPEDAFGEYDPNARHELDKDIFCADGKFDEDHVFPGAVITLLGPQDEPIMVRVEKVGKDSVTVDANHPLAGKTLNFKGKIRENREATQEEVQALIRQLTGDHRCGGCGHHGEGGGDCGHHGEGEGCCGNHGEGEGCCGGGGCHA
ncbi:MAG: FKBP-type peptidyl-prolyl cis-trans isomerase [Prevotella sp.]|nr:FKBP-type peptidyl-prolyl cis-trans isomerase [Prevotella sp.]